MCRWVRVGFWALAALGCGKSESDPTPTPEPLPKPKSVTLSAPPADVINGYFFQPDPRAVDTLKTPYSADEFIEAIRLQHSRIEDGASEERAFRTHQSILGRRQSVPDPKRSERKVSEAACKDYLDALEKAERLIVDAILARLKSFSTASPEFMRLGLRCGLSNHAVLERAAIDEYLRVDRTAAEDLIFDKSFFWLGHIATGKDHWLRRHIVIPLAVKMDAERAKKGLDAWLEAKRQSKEEELAWAEPEVVEAIQSLLARDGSKDALKKLAMHPLAYTSSPSVITPYVLAHTKDFSWTDEDRADILIGLVTSSTRSVSVDTLDKVIGKRFESSGDQVVSALAKLFAELDPTRGGQWWTRIIRNTLIGFDEKQFVALFKAVEKSGAGKAGMRKLCSDFYNSDEKVPWEPLFRACVRMLGTDSKENDQWLKIVWYHYVPEAGEELRKVLLADDMPTETILYALFIAKRGKEERTLLPVADRILRNRAQDVPQILKYLKDYFQPDELVTIAPAFVESFATTESIDGSVRLFRRKVIAKGDSKEAAPRLAAFLAKDPSRETKVDLLQTMGELKDARIVKVLVDLGGKEKESIVNTHYRSVLATLGGEPLKASETLPDWYQRVRTKLPKQVEAKE